jgi:CheY-like chemotaxis protein
MSSQDPYILMLGHDKDDQQLTLSVLDELGIREPIRFVPNGPRLFAALEENEPMLVLLDFNLKPETGLELLAQIQQRVEWRHIPIVMLGDSPDPDFVKRCYQQGARSYIVKPTSLEATRRVIAGFFDYWLHVADTPTHSARQNLTRT